MSETLTIRLRAAEKAQWERAAAAVKESVADYVRNAVRQRGRSEQASGWEKYLGAAHASVEPPTNKNIRRAFARRSKPKR